MTWDYPLTNGTWPIKGQSSPRNLVVSATLTVNDMIVQGMVIYSGGGGDTLTTPTAAQIVAAYPGASVGKLFTFFLADAGAGPGLIVLAGGVGVTIETGDGGSGNPASAFANATGTSGGSRLFVVRITNVTVGAQAVVID